MDLHRSSFEGRRPALQRNRKSFLFVLLILNTLLPKTLSSNVKRFPINDSKDCNNITNNSECECDYGNHGNYTIICPKTENFAKYPNKMIQITSNKYGLLNIKCAPMSSSDYNILPEMAIGDIRWVEIHQCQLPLPRLFDKLGVNGALVLNADIYDPGQTLTRHYFLGLKNLVLLFLVAPNLTRISDDLFGDLENLTDLYLLLINRTLPKNLLMPLKNLNNLQLLYNNRSYLPPGIFQNQQKLNELHLSSKTLLDLNKYSFEGLSSLTFLDISRCNIETLQPDVFEFLTNLRNIDLSANRFRELPKGLFANTKNLTFFSLKENHDTMRELPPGLLSNLPILKEVHLSCGLEIIPEDLFSNSPSILKIYLIGNNLKTLPESLLADQQSLIRLDLSDNQLTALPEDIFRHTFEGLSNLTILNISHSNIDTLQPDVFEFLTNLRNIDLSENRFRELPKGLFANTKNLTFFSLEKNHDTMRELPPGLLSNLAVLKEVHLSCGLEIIAKDLFSNSPSILRIYLIGNNLKTLPESLLADQQSLIELDLSANQLTVLPEDIFKHNKYLKVLRLSYNQLKEIKGSIFSSLDFLEELYMDNNQLSYITFNAFKETRRLRHLNLQNNRFAVDLRWIELSPFSYLNHLEVLNLRNNSIIYMLSDLKMMNNLRELDLSYNNISRVSLWSLQNHSSDPLRMNLEHNQIESVNLEDSGFLNGQSFHVMLNLNNNPLRCDCELFHFVQFLKEPNQNTSLKLNDGLSCVYPENLKGKDVRGLPAMELLCAIDHEDSAQIICPTGCKCWERPYDLAMVINCANGNRTEVPDLPRASKFKLNSTELNMENNTLMRLPLSDSVGYAEVTRLMLAGNKLRKLEAASLPPGLKFIDLRRNELSALSETVLNFFNSSQELEIRLSENPWICDCRAIPLLLFSHTSNKKIPDRDEIECIAPMNKKRFFQLSVTDICPTDRTLVIAIVAVIAMLLSLIGFVAAAYYKYQQEIKIWLYAHNWCLWFVTEEELDKDKKYDAFISYSHKDEKFVAETLVPQLENGSVPFKVCVHFRDFLVGECIPDQIARSVDESRRTIVVLSQHFIESVWARLEFRAAHQAALTEKRARVIVIMYSDIGNPDNLDMELQAYLKMNTYLKWGDPWFWDKLRYAMPHPSQNLNGPLQLHMITRGNNESIDCASDHDL